MKHLKDHWQGFIFKKITVYSSYYLLLVMASKTKLYWHLEKGFDVNKRCVAWVRKYAWMTWLGHFQMINKYINYQANNEGAAN